MLVVPAFGNMFGLMGPQDHRLDFIGERSSGWASHLIRHLIGYIKCKQELVGVFGRGNKVSDGMGGAVLRQGLSNIDLSAYQISICRI